MLFIEIAARNPIAALESVTPEDLKNTPCILTASKGQQRTEQTYYREIFGLRGDFLFADNMDEARVMVVQNNGFMPIDDGAEQTGDTIVRIPLCRGDRPIRQHYCAFWKTDHSGCYVEEFEALLNTEGYGYLNGKSELALKQCLTSRYPRESYILTDKLTNFFFKKQEDIRPFFESQLKACGVDYFDFYLMHAQGAENFAFFKKCRAYETALELKAEGKFKHFGISFHDKAEVLAQILTEYPQVEVVQIQFNYVDCEDPAVESRKCCEVCQKFGKPVIVMEWVKGGNLANLPDDAKAVLDALHGGSPASYAMRYAAGFENNMVVPSGMSNMEQMEDNISAMKDFRPLSDTEQAAIDKVCESFRSKNLIPCTSCRYCTAGCPQQILIPDLFACLNAKKVFNNWNTDYYYNMVYTIHNGKASACVKCGKCEHACPQHLPIRDLLVDVAAEFDRH